MRQFNVCAFGRIILKWILKKEAGKVWIGLIWFSTGTSYCERGQRASGFYKMEEIS